MLQVKSVVICILNVAFIRYSVYNSLVVFEQNSEVKYMGYIMAKEAAQKWGISERRVQVLCEQGRIEGVFRLGKVWAIPQNATKPPDARRKISAAKSVNRKGC